MAIDAMRILGTLMNSGALSSGSGSNVLGSVLGAVTGGGQQAGGGLGGLLGSVMGGGQAQAGNLAGMLGNVLGGGASSAQPEGGLGALLGAAMGQLGGAEQQEDGAQLANFGSAPADANEQAMLVIQAMINAAKSDGHVDESEQQKIIGKLGDVTQEELDFVKQALAEPLDAPAFINSIPAGMGQDIYVVSLMAIDLDTNEEAQYLDQLAKGVGLAPEACNQIHDQMGIPKLYS